MLTACFLDHRGSTAAAAPTTPLSVNRHRRIAGAEACVRESILRGATDLLNGWKCAQVGRGGWDHNGRECGTSGAGLIVMVAAEVAAVFVALRCEEIAKGLFFTVCASNR